MKIRHISKANIAYDIITKAGTTWTTVERDLEFLALCMDKEAAYQTIYQDIKALEGECEFLTREDFRKMR